MSTLSQIFKDHIPKSILIDFLEKICEKTTKYYIFDLITYRKAIHRDLIVPFFKDCEPYYYNSKLKYLRGNVSFKSFATVMRQICNYHKIPYITKIKHVHSQNEINYFIYF